MTWTKSGKIGSRDRLFEIKECDHLKLYKSPNGIIVVTLKHFEKYEFISNKEKQKVKKGENWLVIDEHNISFDFNFSIIEKIPSKDYKDYLCIIKSI